MSEPKLSQEFNRDQARTIMRFLRRMEKAVDSGLATAKEAKKIHSSTETARQVDYWTHARGTIRWAIGLVNTAYPNR